MGLALPLVIVSPAPQKVSSSSPSAFVVWLSPMVADVDAPLGSVVVEVVKE